MSERPTQELVTPMGHKVVVKTYITGAESDVISRKIFAGVVSSAEKPTVPTTAGLDKIVFTLQEAIVSFDGEAENAFDKLNNLPLSERNYVLAEFRKLAGGNF